MLLLAEVTVYHVALWPSALRCVTKHGDFLLRTGAIPKSDGKKPERSEIELKQQLEIMEEMFLLSWGAFTPSCSQNMLWRKNVELLTAVNSHGWDNGCEKGVLPAGTGAE